MSCQSVEATTRRLMLVLTPSSEAYVASRAEVDLCNAGNNKLDADKALPFANKHGTGTWVHACFHNVTAMVGIQHLQCFSLSN